MYNKKVLAKALLSVVLAVTLAFPSTAFPVLGRNAVVRAEAAEKNESTDILKEADVEVNDLGFAQYLSIVLEDGVKFDECSFAVDGVSIQPSKVSDTGSVSKWELVHLQHKALTVTYGDKTQTVVFNANGTGETFTENSDKLMPKWIWSSGAISVFEYHASSYDADGKKFLKPAKSTFDVLNTTEEKREIAYFVTEAVYDETTQGNEEFKIKFSLKDKEAEDWFDSISKVNRMATSSQSNASDEELDIEKRKVIYSKQGSSTLTGEITVKKGQKALRRLGMNYIRIVADKGTVVLPVEIVSSKEPKFTITGAITNVKVGETFKFKVDNTIQGLLLNKEYIQSAVLKRPVKDNSKEKEEVKLEPIKDIYIIDQLLGIDGKVLTKAGWYELELDLQGYKKVSTKFKVRPSKKKPNTSTENQGNSQNNQSSGNSSSGNTNHAGGNSGNGSSSNAGNTGGSSSGGSFGGGSSSSGGGFSGGSSSSGGGFSGGGSAGSVQTATNTEKKTEINIEEDKTPLSYAPIKNAKVKVLKAESEKAMKKAITKDVKAVFGDNKNIRLEDLLLYIYKADSKKNQKLAGKLSEANLKKRVRSFIAKLNIISKKQLTDKALAKLLSQKEVQRILDSYIKAKAAQKTVKGKAVRIHALGGATASKKIHISGKKSGNISTDLTGASSVNIQGEFLFDYDMLVNALILKEQKLGNVYSDKIANMFYLGITQHRAIFTNANALYNFDQFMTARNEAEFNDSYLDYASYVQKAGAVTLSNSAHQLTIVLDNGALGGHYFGGLSANPDEFGAKLPKIEKQTVKWGEGLRIDLKDKEFVDRIHPYGGIMVNRTYPPATDTYGTKIDGTVLTMPAEEIKRAVESAELKDGKKSFFIEIDARGYKNLHIDVDVTDLPQDQQEPEQEPQKPEETGKDLPKLYLKLTSDILYGTDIFQLVNNIGAAEDNAYMNAITSLKVGNQTFSKGTKVDSLKDNEFITNANEGKMNVKFGSEIKKMNSFDLMIVAEGYKTLTLKVDLKKKTVEAVTSNTGNGQGNPADPQGPSNPPSPGNNGQEGTEKNLPEFTPKIEERMNSNGEAMYNIIFQGTDVETYVKAIKEAKVDRKNLAKVSYLTNADSFTISNEAEGKLGFFFSKDLADKNNFNLEIKAEGYKTLTLKVDLKKKTVEAVTSNTGNGQGENPSNPQEPSNPPSPGNNQTEEIGKELPDFTLSMSKRGNNSGIYDINLGATREVEAFVKAIKRAKADGAELKKDSYLDQDNEFTFRESDGTVNVLFSTELVAKNNFNLEIKADGYKTLVLKLDLNAKTVERLIGNTGNQSVPQGPSEPGSSEIQKIDIPVLPSVYVKKALNYLQIGFPGEGGKYFSTITSVTVNETKLELYADMDGFFAEKKDFRYAPLKGTHETLGVSLNDDMYKEQGTITVVITSSKYKDLKVKIDLSKVNTLEHALSMVNNQNQ